MKKITVLIALVCTTLAISQTPCDNGNAGSFPCENFDLQSRITPGQMNASFANDSWGWTDSTTGKEYAVVGLDNGTAFVDVTDPLNPLYLGKLPTHTSSSTWRDVKVYQDYAFIVSEATNHGMQIFDLTRLRNVSSPPETFNNDAHYNVFGSAHNIVINEDTGFAYAVGTATFNGGPHFVNIQDPLNPIPAGGFALDDYSHDAQVVTYNGPDSDYTGREIYLGSHGTFGSNDVVSIVDVTDKNLPVPIATISYPNNGYAHQGWFTEDQKYFLLGDELDEQDIGFNTRTIIMDLTDLDNPSFFFEFFGRTSAIDHNGYVVGDQFFLASYAAGISILDISDIANQNISEYGYFDTYPSSNSANFNGVWSVYPFFESKNIMISGDAGLTIVRDANVLGIDEVSLDGLSIFPNPSNGKFTISSKQIPLSHVRISNVLGQILYENEFTHTSKKNIDISNLSPGVYVVKINNTVSKQLIIK